MTVREMLARIGADELNDWAHYFALEPCGPERGDLQAGIVASVICNILSGKGAKTLSPSDFLLTFEPKKDKTTAELAAFFRQLTVLHGGKIQ